MLATLRQLLRPRQSGRAAAIPAGRRIYAIGDVHGQLDLLVSLAHAIEADEEARGPAETTIVLLGDLVDRGPSSAAVLAYVRGWNERRRLCLLAGNHEEVFLDSLESDESMRQFLYFGGWETLLSYGVNNRDLAAATLEEARKLMRETVPEKDLEFVRGFQDYLVVGDYLFVHAGIRPGIPPEEQETKDLRWIRKPFLNDTSDHGFVVVHGHTITAMPDFRPNRIGIDTGAYMSGRLTALGLEGTQRWLLHADAPAPVEEKEMPGGL